MRDERLASLRGPLILASLCAVPLVLWARSDSLDNRFTGTFATLTSLAVLLAYAGTTAFALNLVLGARLRPVESLFGGLDRMYRAHRLNGQIAFFLLLGHVILILAGRATISAETALDLLRPGAGWTVFTGVLAFAGMTAAILLTVFVRLGHEVFVYVQRSFGFVFLLATYHALTTDGATGALELYLAMIASLGIAAFVYRSLLASVLVRRRRYRVVAVNRLGELVTEIVMEPRGKRLAHRAGQFVFVNFRSLALAETFRPFELSVRRGVLSIRAGEIGNQFHPFSITSSPSDHTLRITVKAVGDYTRALRGLDSGAEAIVEGPYGAFTHDVSHKRQIWLAGGIGVTPFLSMARSLDEADDRAIDFYYCVEHEGEAHFLDELRAIEARRSGFRVVVVAADVEGFLSAERLAAAHDDLTSRAILICGPPAMIANLRTQLVGVGVPPEQIYAEEFGFAKLGRTTLHQAAAAADRVARQPWSDARVLAVLSVLAFASLTFAIGLVAGYSLAPEAERRTVGEETAARDGSAVSGRAVFVSAGCGDCHALSAAGTDGGVGPDLDAAKPTAQAAREIVAGGKGAMPGFAAELSDQELDDVAAFVAGSTGGGER